MRALYEARLEHLGPDDRIVIECVCGHSELVPAIGFIQGWKLPPHTHVLDLARRMRCRECDAKGKVSVSVRWEKFP